MKLEAILEFCLISILCLLAIMLTRCSLPNAEGMQNVLDMVDQTLDCEQIASECFEAVGGISKEGVPLQSVELVKSCLQRWNAGQCTELLKDYREAAEALK